MGRLPTGYDLGATSRTRTVDAVRGLSPPDMLGVVTWLKFGSGLRSGSGSRSRSRLGLELETLVTLDGRIQLQPISGRQ